MPSHTAIITSAKTGPDRTVAGVTLQNIKGIDFQLDSMRLFIQVEQGSGDNIREFDLNGVTAVTVAISAGAYTVTVVS